LNKAADLLQNAAGAHREVLAGLRHPEAARHQIASALQEKLARLAALGDVPSRLPLRGKARGYGRKVLDPDQARSPGQIVRPFGGRRPVTG
jgi:hypothetical protein